MSWSSGRQRGAALLMAMVIVALVATMAASMVWQQWRSVQVESAERARQQAYWILQGALDYARLILREDLKSSSNIDHLGEPWATPLAEARLSSFLAADREHTDDAPDGFLSGAIVDAQSRYNLFNLVANGKVAPDELKAFSRLCNMIGVADNVAQLIAEQLAQAAVVNSATASQAAPAPASTDAPPAFSADNPPLMPQHLDQLRWLGVSAGVIDKLRPFVTLLPAYTSVNINTAPKEVLAAVIDGLDLSSAQRLIQVRQSNPFKNINEVATVLGRPSISGSPVGVASSYFEVSGRLRLGERILEQRYVVMRVGLDVIPIYQERSAGLDTLAAAAPQH